MISALYVAPHLILPQIQWPRCHSLLKRLSCLPRAEVVIRGSRIWFWTVWVRGFGPVHWAYVRPALFTTQRPLLYLQPGQAAQLASLQDQRVNHTGESSFRPCWHLGWEDIFFLAWRWIWLSSTPRACHVVLLADQHLVLPTFVTLVRCSGLLVVCHMRNHCSIHQENLLAGATRACGFITLVFSVFNMCIWFYWGNLSSQRYKYL